MPEQRRQRAQADLAGAEQLRPDPGDDVVERRRRLAARDAGDHVPEPLAEEVDGRRLVEPVALDVERRRSEGARRASVIPASSCRCRARIGRELRRVAYGPNSPHRRRGRGRVRPCRRAGSADGARLPRARATAVPGSNSGAGLAGVCARLGLRSPAGGRLGDEGGRRWCDRVAAPREAGAGVVAVGAGCRRRRPAAAGCPLRRTPTARRAVVVVERLDARGSAARQDNRRCRRRRPSRPPPRPPSRRARADAIKRATKPARPPPAIATTGGTRPASRVGVARYSRSVALHARQPFRCGRTRAHLGGARLAVGDLRDQRREALALGARLDARHALQERAPALRDAAVHLRVREAGRVADLAGTTAPRPSAAGSGSPAASAPTSPRRRGAAARSARRARRSTSTAGASPSSGSLRRDRAAGRLAHRERLVLHDRPQPRQQLVLGGRRRLRQQDLDAALVGVLGVLGRGRVAPRRREQAGGMA